MSRDMIHTMSTKIENTYLYMPLTRITLLLQAHFLLKFTESIGEELFLSAMNEDASKMVRMHLLLLAGMEWQRPSAAAGPC